MFYKLFSSPCLVQFVNLTSTFECILFESKVSLRAAHLSCASPPTSPPPWLRPRPTQVCRKRRWWSRVLGLRRSWTQGRLLLRTESRSRRPTGPAQAPASCGPTCRSRMIKRRRRRRRTRSRVWMSARNSSPDEGTGPERTPWLRDSAPGLICPSRRREWRCRGWGWGTWSSNTPTKPPQLWTRRADVTELPLLPGNNYWIQVSLWCSGLVRTEGRMLNVKCPNSSLLLVSFDFWWRALKKGRRWHRERERERGRAGGGSQWGGGDGGVDVRPEFTHPTDWSLHHFNIK